MLPNYFDYIFVHLRQKSRLRPELSPKLLSTLGPNPAQLEKPMPTLNSASCNQSFLKKRCLYPPGHAGATNLPQRVVKYTQTKSN